MIFGRVRGTAICTIKYPDLKGMKLLVMQQLDRHMKAVGPLQVAVDVVQAGPGDLWVDLALVGIVDELVVRPDGEFDYTLKEGWVKYT